MHLAAPGSWRDELIEEYLHLPRVTARRFQQRLPHIQALDMDDLVAAGNLGLCRAALMFDPRRGVQFSTFAIALIRGAILEQLRDWDFVSRTVRQKEKFGDLEIHAPISLDSADGRCYEDVLCDPCPSPEGDALQRAVIEVLRGIVDRLPEREREVIQLYYGAEKTLREIAEIMGVSQSRAFQMRAQALKRLRSDGRLREVVIDDLGDVLCDRPGEV